MDKLGIPEVSVVIPVYNTNSKWFKKSIDSVLSQKDITFEIIIVNDGSTKKSTLLLLNNLRRNPKIRVLTNQNNMGVGYSLNRGILAARGKLIARHDADDMMFPDRLREQVEYMKKNPQIGVISGLRKKIDEHGREINVKETILPFDENMKSNCFGVGIVHPTVCFRKDLVLKFLGYHCMKRGGPEDLELWCRLYLKGVKIKIIEKPWVYYRVSSTQISQDSKLELIKYSKIFKRYYMTKIKSKNKFLIEELFFSGFTANGISNRNIFEIVFSTKVKLLSVAYFFYSLYERTTRFINLAVKKLHSIKSYVKSKLYSIKSYVKSKLYSIKSYVKSKLYSIKSYVKSMYWKTLYLIGLVGQLIRRKSPKSYYLLKSLIGGSAEKQK